MVFLMQYTAPYYRTMVGGDRLASQVAATTSDPKVAEEKPAQLGFPVQVGETLPLLRRIKPDIILLSTPPVVAVDFVR